MIILVLQTIMNDISNFIQYFKIIMKQAGQGKKSQQSQQSFKNSSEEGRAKYFLSLPPEQATLNRRKPGPLQPPSTNSFIELQNLQLQIKQMCETYCRIIDSVLQSDKLMPQDHIQKFAKQLQGKYENVTKQLQLLPTYDERTLQDYENQVLGRHNTAVVRFKEALEAAKFWKNEIHTLICNQLANE